MSLPSNLYIKTKLKEVSELIFTKTIPELYYPDCHHKLSALVGINLANSFKFNKLFTLLINFFIS